MQLKFQIHAKIQKPVVEVFDAIYNPTKLSAYFTTGGASGPLDEGTQVWSFADYPGEAPITVKQVIPNQKIVFQGDAYEPPSKDEKQQLPPPANYKTTVEITFDSLSPNNTLIRIAESGWRETQQGLDGSYGNCHGWTQMSCALKVYLEHGLNLREGFY